MNGKNYESVFKNVGELIDLFLIDDFPGHPYKVIDNSDMTELTESIKANGLLNPIIVRKKADGRYELISGHRRKRAYEILKLKKINAVITDLNDDEAIIMMVDSNYQRSNILISCLITANCPKAPRKPFLLLSALLCLTICSPMAVV